MIKKLKDFLKKEKNVLFAYLFGSYVDGSYRQDSDVDIAVYLKNSSFDKELEIIHKLSKLLNKKIDLSVLNRARNLYLIENILRNGIILKDNQKRLDYEVYKHHQYLDFKLIKNIA